MTITTTPTAMHTHPALAAAEARLINAELDFRAARESGDPVRLRAAQLESIFADAALYRARLDHEHGFYEQQRRSSNLYHVAR